MKKSFAAAAFLFLAVGLLSAFGQVPYGRAGALGAGGLGLTEEQYSKIEDLRLAFQKEILGLESQWRALALEIDALALKGKSHEAELKKIQGIETELDKKYEEHWNQVRSLLTEEQRVFFDRSGGLGLGLGMGYGWGAGRGYGRGYGRGVGYGAPAGFGRGYGGYSRFGAGYGRGIGYVARDGFGRSYGAGRAYGAGNGRGFGAGYGRGFFCPWRWR